MATAYFRELEKENPNVPQWGKFADAMDEVISTCVPVVRCKVCKYAHLTHDGDCKYCENITDDDGFPIEHYRPGDWFCADGERN